MKNNTISRNVPFSLLFFLRQASGMNGSGCTTPLMDVAIRLYYRLRHPQQVATQRQAQLRSEAIEKMEGVVAMKRQAAARYSEQVARLTAEARTAQSAKNTVAVKAALRQRVVARKRLESEEEQERKAEQVLLLLQTQEEAVGMKEALSGALQSLRNGGAESVLTGVENTIDGLQEQFDFAQELQEAGSKRFAVGGGLDDDDDALLREFDDEVGDSGAAVTAATGVDEQMVKLAALRMGWVPANLAVGGGGGGEGGGSGVAATVPRQATAL